MTPEAERVAAWRRKVRGTEPPTHGLYGYVTYSCRCDICTKANRASGAERLTRDEPPTHSVSGYNNYGCRCDICTKANTDYKRNNYKKAETQ